VKLRQWSHPFVLSVLVLAAPLHAAEPVEEVLASGQLEQAYNPVLLNFLLDEGKDSLPEAQHKQAIDQLVTSLKADIEVTGGEQATAALTQAAGLLLGGDYGATMAGTSSEIFNEWVDSAVVLLRAGYKDDAIAFFTKCVSQFPGEDVRGRCALGLVEAQPEKAFELLMGMAADADADVSNMALRLLGRMAGDPNCPEEQKAAILEELTSRSKGMMNSTRYPGAARGLVSANDERAIEPLRDLTGGMSRGDEEKRIAKAGLLLSYDDQEMIKKIRGSMKGGMMGKPKAEQFWAARTLIQVDDEKAHEWVLKALKQKGGGGMFSKKGEKDYFGDTLWMLVRHGGEQAKATFQEAIKKGKGKDDRKALLAIALARVGEASELGRVRQALAETKWGPAYRWQAAISLAKHDDLTGIPVLQELATAEKNKKQKLDPEDVRPDVAWALGEIDHADCVPILTGLLSDGEERTRLAAASALMRMKNPAVLSGLQAALGVDYGKTDRGSRDPIMHARIVRGAAVRFPSEAGAKSVAETGATSGFASVKFLSLLAQGMLGS